LNESVFSQFRSLIQTKNLVSLIAGSIAFWLLLSRATEEYFSSQFQIALLRVEAKCPGLPYGQYSGGPDYIDISIDIGLGVVAAVFIALTIRDIRRRRNSNFSDEDSEDQESDDL
jgi:hypothetical protein